MVRPLYEESSATVAKRFFATAIYLIVKLKLCLIARYSRIFRHPDYALQA
jgi:hypothetical protein